MGEQISASEGQRILSSVHIMCTKFRETVRDSFLQLKQQEYAAAKSETVQAQQAIEAKRLEELQKMADNQTRPLTALEKVRLLHLQDMQDKQQAAVVQQQPEILDKTFSQLLDQGTSVSHYPGLLVEEELEKLITPFVQDLVGRVEELYSVNQQLLRLCSKCRSEALKEKSNSTALRGKIKELQDQILRDDENVDRLRQGVNDRAAQLEALRSAYHKEVIQVKEQMLEQVGKSMTVDDVSDATSRTFDSTLLAQPLGSDPQGRSLDALLQKLIKEYDAGEADKRGDKKGAGEGEAGGAPMPAPASAEGGSAENARIMVLENEVVQLQLRNAVLRHGVETWRHKAEAERVPKRHLEGKVGTPQKA